MKKGKLLLNTVIVLGVAAGAIHFYDDTLMPKWCGALKERAGLKPATLGSYIGSNIEAAEWGDAAALQTKLEADIKALFAEVKPAEVKQSLNDPQARLLLAQWMLATAEKVAMAEAPARAKDLQQPLESLRKEKEDLLAQTAHLETPHPRDDRRLKLIEQKLARHQKEADQPMLLSDAIQDASKKQLMHELGNNLDWMEQIAFTGEMVRPAKILNILSDIQKMHPDMLTNQMVRDIATATAIEFAKAGVHPQSKEDIPMFLQTAWLHDVALERADFYITHWKKGDLNSVFDTLPFWERRMVCGNKGDNDFGSRASLEWALQNMHLPADRYTQDCPHYLYRLYSLYGDSVHGPHYVEPYADLYEDNNLRFVKEVGGICGSLSHFCTFAALANGVPALTTGEPGHCSYVVKVGDDWVSGYNLDWQRGLHWRPWAAIKVFSCLHMASELFSEAQKENTQLSQAYRVLGKVYAGTDAEKAHICYQEAVKAQPTNVFAWRDYANFLGAAFPNDAEAWLKLNNLMCRSVVKRYPEVCAKVLENYVYPGMKAAVGEDTAALQQAFAAFWGQVDAMGPARWRIEEMMTVQCTMLGKEIWCDATFEHYESTLKALASNKVYMPVMFAWGNEQASHVKKDKQARLMNTMVSAMGGSSLDEESRCKMLNPIILAAEKAGDMVTFQSLSKMVPESFRKPAAKLPSHVPFSGQLMSKGGLLRASATCNYDNPCRHWGVLETGVGGEFHTPNQKNPWVVVQLPKQTKVSGVVVINRPTHQNRVAGMKLQVSETGRDDDWHDVAKFTPGRARIYRASTEDTRPVAKYIRIYRTGDSTAPFHLNAIYVYGYPSA